MPDPRHRAPFSRRRAVAGLGLAGAAAVFAPSAADAAPTGARHRGPSNQGEVQDAAPSGLNPIASAPLTGYTYTFLDMWDFTPENFISGRTWTSAGGTYAPVGSGDTMWATTQLPAGAVLGDVEWYVSATSATELMGRIWVAGTPTLMKKACDGIILGSSEQGLVRAKRIVPSVSTNGPYPHGTKLALGVFTPSDASVAVNGVRIGYKLAPAGEVLLPAPIRVYDSRPGTKIENGHTRTHSVAGQLPVGAVGALLNVTVVGTEGTGFLTVYSSAVAQPAASSTNWFGSNQILANGVETAIPSGRSFKVTCGGGHRTDYILDLVGYLV
jgi:hypothetical protein